MTGNSPTGNDAYYRSYDDFSFSQFFEISYDGAGSATGVVDVNQVSWEIHPRAVDELSQQQHHDSPTPPASLYNPVFPEPASPFYEGANDEMSSDLLASFGGFAPYSSDGILPPVEGSASIPLATGLVQPTTSFINMGAQSATVPAISPATCKVADEEILLKSLRDAGYGYAAISEAMREQLGIEITANALVKRYQKMPKTCESLLANAIANIMPQIMEQLYAELPHIDDGTLSPEEKETVNRMLQDLPQVLPNCVRSSLSRKRRNMQPSSSL